MIELKKANKNKIMHDSILALICIVAALGVWVVVRCISSPGINAIVTVNGEEYGSYSLNKDTTIVIETEYGTNTLEIKDGYANVTEADCPDKICVNTHKISKSGETITCLPHKLVVTIDGEGSDFVE